MGYAAGPLFESLTIDPKVSFQLAFKATMAVTCAKNQTQKDKKSLGELTWVHPRTCPQLKHAIDVLPGRPQMGECPLNWSGIQQKCRFLTLVQTLLSKASSTT